MPAVEVPVETRTFVTSLLAGTLSNEAAALTTLELRNYKEPVTKGGEEQPVSLATAKPGQSPRQAVIAWQVGGELGRLRWQGGDGLALAGETPAGVRAEVEVKPRQDAYAIDYVLRIRNDSGQPLPVGATVKLSLRSRGEKKGSFLGPPPDLMNGLCALPGDVVRTDASELAED